MSKKSASAHRAYRARSMLFGCVRGAILDVLRSHPDYVGERCRTTDFARSVAKRACGNFRGALSAAPDQEALFASLMAREG